MDQKALFMLSLSLAVYFAAGADRRALACNNQIREVQAVEVVVKFVYNFVSLQ